MVCQAVHQPVQHKGCCILCQEHSHNGPQVAVQQAPRVCHQLQGLLVRQPAQQPVQTRSRGRLRCRRCCSSCCCRCCRCCSDPGSGSSAVPSWTQQGSTAYVGCRAPPVVCRAKKKPPKPHEGSVVGVWDHHACVAAAAADSPGHDDNSSSRSSFLATCCGYALHGNHQD